MIAKRRLGKEGPEVGAVGYGAMVLAGYYGPVDEDAGVRAIHRGLDAGVTMIDTADAYGNGSNEMLVGRALKGRRSEAFVATKFGLVFEEGVPGRELETGWGFSLSINGTREYANRALEASLRRLDVDVIDLWYAHYPDPETPIEETVAAMADAVRRGHVRYLGLSNMTAEQVRRAHAVFPITAVQYEYSLWRREAEVELLPTLRELGIGLVPWSPLGTGFLSGKLADLADDDFRNYNPKITGENGLINRSRFAPLRSIANDLEITEAQLALAWLLHKGKHIVPIPGTRRAERVEENAAAADVSLSPDVMRRLETIAPVGLAEGATLVG